MQIAPISSSRRGSALLIVLGLLSFLMISAVAFSISMRTEYAAAASYRRSATTRELLVSAFTDARATVEFAMRNQLGSGFDRTKPETRTVEALAPFKYEGKDRYGRLISSHNIDAGDDHSIAYLLDDAVMRHVPPYVANTVYRTLELQSPPFSGETDGHALSGEIGYHIDWSASWKPITAKIPDDSKNQKDNDDYVNETVVGRMAWAVVNLSDSLDINAIGSASNYRGIGLTGSEFAFGTAATGSTAVAANEMYNLLESQRSTDASVDLPLFASNADLAQYAAQVSSATSLTLDDGSIFPYSWEDAVDQEGDGFYSPFSVYSFWPAPDRKKEDGTRAQENETSSDGTRLSTVISCNDVTETELRESGSGIAGELADLTNDILGESGSTGENLARMLADYIDPDSVPTLFNPDASEDIYPHAAPTVERVPMVSEVSFGEEGWGSNGKMAKDLQKNIEDAFEGLSPDGKGTTYKSREEIPGNLGDQKIDIELPELTQWIGLRAYFPGGEDSSGNFTLEPEGILGVTAVGSAGGAKVEFDTSAKATKISVSEGLPVDSGSSDIFFETGATPSITLRGRDIKLSLKGEDIPVVDTDSSTNNTPQPVTLTFLVDFLFRVKVMSGSDIVDCSPADREGVTTLLTETDYPENARNRVNSSTMSKLDAQYFRITRPLTVTFALEWDVAVKTSESGDTYTVETKFSDSHKLEVKFPYSEPVDFEGKQIQPARTNEPSYLSSSESYGAWYSIDPRYNWLSPMMGSSGNTSAYGIGHSGVQMNFSSPHWIFINGGELTTGGLTPSDVQKDYATKNSGIVPFVWGLEVQDIRYGHNDSGQLLLPAETGFLPVPFATNVWHPQAALNYSAMSITDYYNKVAKLSFFRTLPAVDFDDGAADETAYNRYMNLTTMFKSFAGNNFPEEHRGIVHAFAGQDDYYTCQRLRQFAMLGIPSSISQAAKVTFERLTAASEVSRVSPEMLKTDLKDLNNETIKGTQLKDPKYDTFIRDYLFYVPDNVTSGEVDSWESGQEPYKGAGSNSTPTRVRTVDDIILQSSSSDASFVDKLRAYNDANSSDKLGQNDMTTLLAMGRECFGDRQQLFLYILRADSIAYNSSRDLSQHKTLATARAVALVWRDAYGELPDRVIYYQLLP